LDDYQDIKIEGAHAALPIWVEFMKRAHKHRAYRDVTQFEVPQGVVSAQIDPLTGDLATSACPQVETAYYLLGTQPAQFCPLHQGGSTEIAGWETAPMGQPSATRAVPGQPSMNPGENPLGPPYPNQPQNKPPDRKRSLMDKLKSIFH
jgi:penicillin-binding protein 1B